MDLLVAMRTFSQVVLSGSMNEAARRLNVTSALVGQRIAALEDHLQVKLLNRTTRQHSLTEFGQTYLEQCRDILELVAQSEGEASDQQSSPQGQLRIAAPISFGSEALMPALKEFCEDLPNVHIDLVLSDNYENLTSGGVDVAFRIGELDDSTLIQIPLAPYKMVVCATPHYAAKFGAPNSPDDLNGHQAILFSKTSAKSWKFSKDGQVTSWVPISGVTVNSGQAVRVAVNESMGIAMLPRVLVAQDFSAGKLIEFLPNWALAEKPMSVIYHRDRYMPQRLSRFLKFAKAKFGKSLA
ncbi:MAG: LysR family transcriptional regulator [Hyphomicrobiales bacterium]